MACVKAYSKWFGYMYPGLNVAAKKSLPKPGPRFKKFGPLSLHVKDGLYDNISEFTPSNSLHHSTVSSALAYGVHRSPFDAP